MQMQLKVGDKIRGDYGLEGEIIRISSDGYAADVKLPTSGAWHIVVSTCLAHLDRIESYTKKPNLHG